MSGLAGPWREPDKGRDLSAVERTKLRQVGDQGPGDCLSDAGFSFLRGLPVLRKWLLGVMREGEAMPATDRLGAALILTSQGAFAFLFAVAAQFFLTWGVVYHLMPRLGLGILDLAKTVAM